ncbi:MAG: Maf family protein [Clostridiales bacterium]|nr:Maf family protein [Roseburia sp.]MDD7638188.1 Maf family protein [Clostridiales bacterium]MDY4112502.1 Maf family protein [Roseburia sp.]
MGQIILASASPRRKELLEQIGISFDICPAKGEEIITKKIPHEVVQELASQKAKEVAGMVKAYEASHEELMTPQDIMVIGADTIVAYENQILGKPKEEEDAFRMLSLLSGNTHSVYTGVSIVLLGASGKVGELTFYEKTDVAMRQMDDAEIRRYIATGEPMDKAGAYGIQGKCAIYIDKISGDYNNVVGLPVAAIYRELKKLGIDLYLW